MIIDALSNESWSLTNPGGNYSNNGYPTRISTLTPPPQQAVSTGLQAVGDGVIPLGHGGSIAPKHLVLIPFAAGSATNTFAMKVLGWRATKLGIGLPLWIPVELCTYAITVGTGTGVTTADLTSTALFATTITSTGGPTFITSGAAPVIPDWCQISPGSNGIGLICQATFGFRYLEVIFTTGGSATSCNSLFAKM